MIKGGEGNVDTINVNRIEHISCSGENNLYDQ